MIYRTFAEWKLQGFAVISGEKYYKRNEWNECLFSEEQVTEIDKISELEAEMYGLDGCIPNH